MNFVSEFTIRHLNFVRNMEIVQPNYKLTFEVHPEHLFARVEASAIDRSTSLEYLSEVSLKCADERRRKLLLERDIPVILDEPVMDSIVEEYIRLCTGVTIALVNRYADLNSSTEYIIEHLNTRGVNFKYFDNVKAAEEWLLSQSIPDLFAS